MPKTSSKRRNIVKKGSNSAHSLDELNEELRAASGKLLETSGTMHGFTQSLQTSGFREYVDYMGRPWYSFWFNFLIGIARGFGFVLGATVVVAIVVWIVSSVLTQLPYVGEFFETLEDFMSEDNLGRIQAGKFGEAMSEMLDAFKVNVLESYEASDVAN